MYYRPLEPNQEQQQHQPPPMQMGVNQFMPYGMPPFGYPHQALFHPPPIPQHHSFDSSMQLPTQNPLLSSSSFTNFSILSNSTSMMAGGATPSSSNTPNTSNSPPTLPEIFDDLASRFVLNIPQEELESFERLLFQIEAAHWFYEDFYREEHPALPKYNLAEFTKVFFNSCPLLQPYQNNVEEICKKFSEYKTRVPVFGCIILNQDLDKALFVKGYGSSSWGFPKGKVNKDEADHDCAIREVYEETGFDCTNYLNQKHFLEILIKEQKTKLYIVAGVPEETVFKTRTRKEISKIEWIPLDDLPTVSSKKQPGAQSNPNYGNVNPPTMQTNNSTLKEKNFYRAFPFFSKLKRWVALRKAKYPKELYPTTPHQNNPTITILTNTNTNNNSNNSSTNLLNQTPKNTNVNTNQKNNEATTLTTPISKIMKPNYSPYPNSPPVSPREVFITTQNLDELPPLPIIQHNALSPPKQITILQNLNKNNYSNNNNSNNNNINNNNNNIGKKTASFISHLQSESLESNEDDIQYPKIPDSFQKYIFTMESFKVDTMVNFFVKSKIK
ncbi:hypothetical protein DLAC_05919 [Tieghemostelium lacteum]|uniref:Nudix hydrolase domain-containing protein n=1 Tax=Tieghemostelium lacteum TaxID=361077 RepID=A0A151ZH14_TIELA|nr:hypothetical protein DLAC_05919 [Tieghemostelium lacteum]|eukprot:KYQ93263.1 hypothetical protein DLAC_05919 [Tieghemostelium lacteum]